LLHFWHFGRSISTLLAGHQTPAATPTQKNFSRLGGLNQASVFGQPLRLLELGDLPNEIAIVYAGYPFGGGDKSDYLPFFSIIPRLFPCRWDSSAYWT
jgi:hypothetical protein